MVSSMQKLGNGARYKKWGPTVYTKPPPYEQLYFTSEIHSADILTY